MGISSPSLLLINLEPPGVKPGAFFMEIITHKYCTITAENFKSLFELNKQMKEQMLFLEEQHRYAVNNQAVMHTKMGNTEKQINFSNIQILSLSAVVNFISQNKPDYFHDCETLYGHSVRGDFQTFINELNEGTQKLALEKEYQTEECNKLKEQSEIAFRNYSAQRHNFTSLHGALGAYYRTSVQRFSKCWTEVKKACPSLTDGLFGGQEEINKILSGEFFENMYDEESKTTPFYVLIMGICCSGSEKSINELIFNYAVDAGWLSSKAALECARLINIGTDVASNLAQLEDKIDMMQIELDDLRRRLYQQ